MTRMELHAALADYARYHRDPRNIATHAVGIPAILLAVMILLSRPHLEIAGLTLSPASLAMTAAVAFYARLDIRFAGGMALVFLACHIIGAHVAAQSTPIWFASGAALFAVGWALQFAGHYFEGQQPAFVDDRRHLLIGPLFILAKAVTAVGLREDVRTAVGAPVEN